MEGSSKFIGQQYHVRSISLHSRLHLTSLKIETELNNLKTSISHASSLNPDTIQSSLVGLAELYISVEELIHSPLTQKSLFQHRDELLVENVLEGSIGLLDSCCNVKGLLSLMKENVQELQSALRRKGATLSIQSHVSAYFCSQKQAKKIISKGLRELKHLENKTGAPLLLDVDQHLTMVVRVLREVSDITLNIFRYVLLFLSASSSKSKPSLRWSVLSKLMMKTERDQSIVTEVERVDVALHSLHRQVDVQIAQRRLRELDARIECFETGLDCLFRRLIQSRASLLNILANKCSKMLYIKILVRRCTV